MTKNRSGKAYRDKSGAQANIRNVLSETLEPEKNSRIPKIPAPWIHGELLKLGISDGSYASPLDHLNFRAISQSSSRSFQLSTGRPRLLMPNPVLT